MTIGDLIDDTKDLPRSTEVLVYCDYDLCASEIRFANARPIGVSRTYYTESPGDNSQVIVIEAK
jgi:hypothetical protein